MNKRTFLLLPLSLLPPSLLLAGTEKLLSEEAVTVDYVDGTYHARLSFDLAVPPALALEVLSDFEHMSSFVPNLDSSRVLRREGEVVYIAQQGTVPIGPFAFKFESERRVELQSGGRLVSEAISGSAKKMHSEFRASPLAEGARLEYQVDVIPGRWIPSGLGIHFMRRQLVEQFVALAGEMLRRQASRRGH